VILRPVDFAGGAAALGSAAALAINPYWCASCRRQQSDNWPQAVPQLSMITPGMLGLMFWEGRAMEPGGVISAARFLAVYPWHNVCVLLAYKHVDANQVTSCPNTPA